VFPVRRLSFRHIGPVVALAAVSLAGCATRVPTPSIPATHAAPAVAPTGTPFADPSVDPSAVAFGDQAPKASGTPGPISGVPPTSVGQADWPLSTTVSSAAGFSLHVPILMYHLIDTLADAGRARPGLVIDPAIFGQEMRLLHANGWHTITLATLQLDLATGRTPPPRTLVITIDDGHIDGLTNALPILRQYGFVATYFVVLGRIHSPRFLSAADLVILAQAGMEIADHTMDHRDVARLHGPALDFQIGAGAAAIKQITGRAPTSFAYPSGEWSLEAIGAIQSAGMGVAVTTKEGVLETWQDRFLLPRLRVSPSLTPDALLRMLSGYSID
jgi:peptidoglycan/xylan/chitin deacetylase (PgdA/CDA1 family)